MALPVLFGANIDPVWSDAGGPLRLALQAEQDGLELITIQTTPTRPPSTTCGP